MSQPRSQSRPFRLSPERRIKKRADYERVQQRGRRVSCHHFVVLFQGSLSGGSRLGVTITRKVDPRATARNRLRRRVRELFRKNFPRILAPLDFVVIARNGATSLSFGEVESELLGALSRQRLLAPA